jgi:hypothetical protein
MKTKKFSVLILISVGFMMANCHKPDDIEQLPTTTTPSLSDYRDKWCGAYEFTRCHSQLIYTEDGALDYRAYDTLIFIDLIEKTGENKLKIGGGESGWLCVKVAVDGTVEPMEASGWYGCPISFGGRFINNDSLDMLFRQPTIGLGIIYNIHAKKITKL